MIDRFLHALTGLADRTWKLVLWGIFFVTAYAVTHPGWLPGIGARVTSELAPFFSHLIEGLAGPLILLAIVVYAFKRMTGIGRGGGGGGGGRSH